ncbi:MAG: hypothetical protein NTW17_00340 [Candidatus Pacearchaeota archaeon]|nr:hypothetical protein [Candidatus Pacearchaeota archaeon]
MVTSVPQAYSVSENEYNMIRGFWRVGHISSLTVASTGLAGIVVGAALNHFAGPENSQLATEIMDFSIPLLVCGIFASLYTGINYRMNPSLDKSKKHN